VVRNKWPALSPARGYYRPCKSQGIPHITRGRVSSKVGIEKDKNNLHDKLGVFVECIAESYF
jgi:hypothetical protein